MSDLAPTAEQRLILTDVRETTDNLQVIARAGAGKTTTIRLIAEVLPSCLALAFNKKIADELREKLPASASAATMHSIGNRAFKDFLGKWPKLDDKKMFLLLKEIIKTYEPEDQDTLQEDFNETLAFCKMAKEQGFLPLGVYGPAKPLFTDEAVFDGAEIIPSPLQFDVVRRVLAESFQMAMKGTIDFTDMVYLPALLPVSFPRQHTVIVDEAQDMSVLNHVLLAKIAKGARLIAVGDPCQAIYAFRGAHEESMSLLARKFSMRERYLTICFRSAQAVVLNARWRAPDMQWRDGAPVGAVSVLQKWGPDSLRDGDAVICRNNAPLFRLALALIKAGLMPELSSGDLVKTIGAVFKKLGKPNTPQEGAIEALASWGESVKKKYRSKTALADTMECIRIFLEQRSTLGEAQLLFEQVLARSGRIRLMTGHKSKGLEFDRVFFLDRNLCKPEGQDRNVRYVIETRAREELFYVESAQFGYGEFHGETSHTDAPTVGEQNAPTAA